MKTDRTHHVEFDIPIPSLVVTIYVVGVLAAILFGYLLGTA